MTLILETLAEPLVDFVPLLNYTRGMVNFSHDDIEGAISQ